MFRLAIDAFESQFPCSDPSTVLDSGSNPHLGQSRIFIHFQYYQIRHLSSLGTAFLLALLIKMWLCLSGEMHITATTCLKVTLLIDLVDLDRVPLAIRLKR